MRTDVEIRSNVSQQVDRQVNVQPHLPQIPREVYLQIYWNKYQQVHVRVSDIMQTKSRADSARKRTQ